MLKESHPGLLLTLVSIFVGLSESAGTTSGIQYPICKPGLEFWSNTHSSCSPCTRCAPEITLSPCAVHKDAICGPLSALEIDWSFLSTRKSPEIRQRQLEAVTSKMLWQFPVQAQLQEQQLEPFGDLVDLGSLNSKNLEDDEGSIPASQEFNVTWC